MILVQPGSLHRFNRLLEHAHVYDAYVFTHHVSKRRFQVRATPRAWTPVDSYARRPDRYRFLGPEELAAKPMREAVRVCYGDGMAAADVHCIIAIKNPNTGNL